MSGIEQEFEGAELTEGGRPATRVMSHRSSPEGLDVGVEVDGDVLPGWRGIERPVEELGVGSLGRRFRVDAPALVDVEMAAGDDRHLVGAG